LKRVHLDPCGARPGLGLCEQSPVMSPALSPVFRSNRGRARSNSLKLSSDPSGSLSNLRLAVPFDLVAFAGGVAGAATSGDVALGPRDRGRRIRIKAVAEMAATIMATRGRRPRDGPRRALLGCFRPGSSAVIMGAWRARVR